MTDSLITHLRHVDLAIPDYERQLAFYTDVWGLTKVADDRWRASYKVQIDGYPTGVVGFIEV